MTTKKKPIVECILIGGCLAVGVPTSVILINHPKKDLNNRLCVTSRVIKIDTISFETENTVYIIKGKK